MKFCFSWYIICYNLTIFLLTRNNFFITQVITGPIEKCSLSSNFLEIDCLRVSVRETLIIKFVRLLEIILYLNTQLDNKMTIKFCKLATTNIKGMLLRHS